VNDITTSQRLSDCPARRGHAGRPGRLRVVSAQRWDWRRQQWN